MQKKEIVISACYLIWIGLNKTSVFYGKNRGKIFSLLFVSPIDLYIKES